MQVNDAASNRAIKDDEEESSAVSQSSRPTQFSVDFQSLDEASKPSLPPRRATLGLMGSPTSQKSSTHSLRVPKRTPRPSLQGTATTAVTLTDIHTHLRSDGPPRTPARSLRSMSSRMSLRSMRADVSTPSGQYRSRAASEADETASLRSSAPTAGMTDAESILGDILLTDQRSPGWKVLSEQSEKGSGIPVVPFDLGEPTADFNREFDEIPDIDADGSNEGGHPVIEGNRSLTVSGQLLDMWKSKRKHYLILSAAGKPIYIRHGSDNLISGYIGVIQTILSFFEGSEDQLKSFTAGISRFVVITRGSLYLVAITKLGENDSQLRVQLEALYMQILSTLTLPTLTNLFSKRPSTDLRRPLQGTESLLSALADTFTRGSPPALLSALECLKIKKRNREAINNTLLKSKCKDLLYGLVVAGGRLVSVVRPRTHSLHPGDLQLIFNMLFEAGGVKASEGENWIPMCLPGFNKNGYLYMYVSFLDVLDEEERDEVRSSSTTKEDRVAILLISANKESFYELREMRDKVVEVRSFICSGIRLTVTGCRNQWRAADHQISYHRRQAVNNGYRPWHSATTLSL